MVRRSLRNCANVMKKALSVSGSLNLALALSFFVLLGRRNSEVGPRTSDVPPAKALVETETLSSKSNAFNWREVESQDYRAYIANLRRISCPEQTIRDIIKADVGELYASRRKDLEKSAALPQTLQDRSQALRDEEAWVIAALLGEPSARTEASSALDIPSRSERNRSREQTVSMPLVFQDVNLNQLNLNRDQLQAIVDLRQRFLDEIGGLEQDPNNPAYRERWKKSQPELDNDLRGMIGVTAFQNYQIEAAAPSPAVQ